MIAMCDSSSTLRCEPGLRIGFLLVFVVRNESIHSGSNPISDERCHFGCPKLKDVIERGISYVGTESIPICCADLWNDAFKKNGIAIDKDVKKNVSLDQIFNVHQFKRILKKHYLFSYSLV